MKIFLYEVGGRASIEKTIADIGNREMWERVENISGSKIKLEEVKEEKIAGSNVFLMDFCKHREAGPGRAKDNEEIRGFDLEEDEAFGEMTAALYDPKTNFIVIQYNHHGPRAGSIAEYFSRFSADDSQVEFHPRLKDNILAEIDKKQYNTKLSFSYSSALLTRAHREELGMSSILINLEKVAGGEVGEVEITFKKARGGRHNKMEGQTSFIKKLLRISKDKNNGECLKSAKVVGGMTPEDKPELLDILNAKITEERTGLVRDKKTKMYTFKSRCKLLAGSFESWRESGIITSGLR